MAGPHFNGGLGPHAPAEIFGSPALSVSPVFRQRSSRRPALAAGASATLSAFDPVVLSLGGRGLRDISRQNAGQALAPGKLNGPALPSERGGSRASKDELL